MGIRLEANETDITAYMGGLGWQNTIDELSTKMNFEVAKTNMQYMSIYLPKLGDIVKMHTNTEIFRGIVIAVDDGDTFKNKYTVADFGWYLNKSSETYQFNNMNAKKAIVRICNDFNIPIETIPELTREIKQIYVDKSVSDILKDILNQCGGGYNLDMTPNGLRIYKYGEFYASPEFSVTPNTQRLYSPDYMGGVSHSLSIEDMKNSIKVVTEKDEALSVKKILKDDGSIEKYGLLQQVVKIDPEKENPNTVAEQELNELDKIKENYSIEIIESIDSYTRAGYAITIADTNFIIDSSEHSIENGIHYVKLGLKKNINFDF